MSNREPLTRERILNRALELADESGFEALSMRKLGEALGYEAMSLYRHVSNKGDLLGGMLDLVLAEWELPAAEGEWDDAIRRSAVSVHDSLRRHLWAPSILLTMQGVRPTRLAYMDALLGRLHAAGFDDDATYHAYHVLDGHIFGFSLWERSHSVSAEDLPALAARFAREIPLDFYPHLAEHRDMHLERGPHREVSAFEFGLDLILDGLRKIRLRA
jgi:AcrR family transcriptional regulator